MAVIGLGGVGFGVTVGGTSALATQAVDSQPLDVNGTVVSSNPAPSAVPGSAGNFTLGSIQDNDGNIGPAEDSQGQVTFLVYSTTRFYDCRTSATCTPSSQAVVAAVGNIVRVTGHFQQVNGNYVVTAEYVFWPPVTPVANPPVPQPSKANDYDFGDLFQAIGFVTEPGTYLAYGKDGYSELWGFTMGDFTDYGCGTMTNCLTQRVAASQGGSLDLLAANTNYYVLSATNACQYVKSTDRYTTVNVSGSQNGALVTGHFGWDGTQWQFFVTNFITPPPAATCSNSYGPLTAIASIAESTTGTPQGSGFTGSQWQGTVTNGDAGNTFLGGPVTMTLDWTPDPSVGAWDFSGTYKVAGANGSNNSVSGAVDGAIAPNGAVNANLTITSITGQFAGRTGYGTLTGSASPTPDAHQGPPSFFNVTFSWITQNG